MNRVSGAVYLVVFASIWMAIGCGSSNDDKGDGGIDGGSLIEELGRCADFDPLKRAYFGVYLRRIWQSI